ncbi:hypothetical protein DDB_G0278487 [Dictyostelium discoideum AX4]|uniref:Probable cyclin-dependent serine/threonine-protein kinase DDB_G0278487 n=1 Tax=Dictyostelium discoideum TaxID=44689 RepID=Y8487_DICDI|nr:hypothetical protein DDB_G0278487 [Dictyostelium discoideum AX4]Q54Y06.1 RecName: Full=Probable cyclin-dependent serine/threonine-protein kinase DDB_G0278487 [Dictyostelium discoideum]EAL68416.1 hypothetical protein DDB_G0278487 [Dictyostelium discoideum AX4]|eukprot:XP_642396.1 hypothetical protein DDB_G0278487 [Dictyostelium discoideum AX4]
MPSQSNNVITSSTASSSMSSSSNSSDASSTSSSNTNNAHSSNNQFVSGQLNLVGNTHTKINDNYEIISKIGEGISGSVFKAIKKGTEEMVALKNFKGWTEGDRASKEECSLLQQLRHIPYITPVIDIYTNFETSEYIIVFPYFEHDLSGLLSEHRLSIPQVKCYFKQLLEGINEIHNAGVMHRDIKAANLLVNNKGSLFIGDLGTATSYTKRSVFSSKVVTLWYRAPELLLGSTQYGPEIDMWSIGCVLIELVTSRNFLPGSSEQQQLEAICKLCGTPTDEIWPNVSQLQNFNQISHLPVYPSRLRTVFKNFSNDFIELLEGLLTLNPKKRLTAEQALQSPFFTNHPLPFKPENMPGYQPIHVLEAVQKRVQQQQELEQQKKQEEQKKQQEEQKKLEDQKKQEEQKKQEDLLKRQRLLKRQQELKKQQDEQRQQELIKKQQEQEQLRLKVEHEKQRQEQERLRLIQQEQERLKRQQQEHEQRLQREQQQQLNQLQQQKESPLNNSYGKINLKRSLDLVNDIRNYCTSETESEYESDEEDFYTEEEVEDYSSDEEDDYYNAQSNKSLYTPIKAMIQQHNNNQQHQQQYPYSQQQQEPISSNPFLQPPKKQRTASTGFNNNNGNNNNNNNLSTPLTIH